MYVIHARNVNDAFMSGLALLRESGVREQSRAGEVLVFPTPVVTVYERPRERVLFHSQRDANPFFHLMESLWMLAGRHDALWLDQFVGDFSGRFAEDDGVQHGAYGFRWRSHFDIDGGGHPLNLPDQLDVLVDLLKKNPSDRRTVLTMWDPVADLGAQKRDIPCNTHAYLRVKETPGPAINAPGRGGVSEDVYHPRRVLDITVCCRSNDAVWGAYGANAVHFSVLQEYLAARIGVGVGKYYQLSNNFHVYQDILDKMGPLKPAVDTYADGVKVVPLVNYPDTFDAELANFMIFDSMGVPSPKGYRNQFFTRVAIPLFESYKLWRAKHHGAALDGLRIMPEGNDWRLAAEQWFQRRYDKVKAKRYSSEPEGD
jgi:thymidylate synthase